ncbi:MAG: DUF1223 domain-containing protein [Bacteroidetes bacterium]|nr:DUF1223 domain-containing protein [Bacteroidota bacterium]
MACLVERKIFEPMIRAGYDRNGREIKNDIRKRISFSILSIFFFLHSFYSAAQDPPKPFAVVELFTSEGCATCPPAEKLLNSIITESKKNNTRIFCIEYHVDYWNHGGWRDPFSKNQFTMRQNMYSAVLRQRELYTPQMIVNGEVEFTGSDSLKAKTAINKALEKKTETSLFVSVDSVAGDTAFVNYVASQAGKNFSLHSVIVESDLVSKITKGENAGTTITHNQVARIFYSTSLNEKSGLIKIPLKGMKMNSNCFLIAFVQHKQSMRILAATSCSFRP